MSSKISYILAPLIVAGSLSATTLNLKSGWNLVGSSEKQENIDTQIADANTIWKHDGSSWSAIAPNGKFAPALGDLNLSTFTTVESGDGFWVNMPSESNVTLSGTKPVDTNLSIQSGWNLVSLKTDIDLYSMENFSHTDIKIMWKYVNDEWQAYSNKADVAQLITNAGLKSFNFIKSDEGFWVSSSNGLSVSTTNKDVVQIALSKLHNIDLENDDIESKISDIKETLNLSETDPRHSKDVDVANALIELTEIANSSEVGNLIDVKLDTYSATLPNLLKITTFESDEFVALKESSAYSTNFTKVLSDTADRLKAISDSLGASFSDDSYVFEHNGERIDATKAQLIRSYILAASSSMKYVSAYNLASDEFIVDKNEDVVVSNYSDSNSSTFNVDYNEAKANPIAVLNSTNSLTLNSDSATKIGNSKSLLSEALKVMSSVDVTKIADARQRGDVNNTVVQSAMILTSLNGGANYIDRNDITMQVEFNVNALFTSPVTGNEFSQNWEYACADEVKIAYSNYFEVNTTTVTSSYEANLSKINNKAVCFADNSDNITFISNFSSSSPVQGTVMLMDKQTSLEMNKLWCGMGFKEATPVLSTIPTTTQTNIDNIIVKITETNSTDTTVYEGQELLNKVLDFRPDVIGY
ncbi:MAG: hypothetical protein U9N42_02105 [Campylobacterota bacterium]|nr:hypothetical protein [Campylobacterota bacterium]